ncbi:MAG TPA: hypothetical protein PK159_14215, partial [Steroidobacteraceae bacterium]|nr:hypothetical protein [Steroidobacteraceae bacterium]
MSNTQALTIAFMRSHAAEAAQVLESAAPATLAELFAAVPVRVGGPVLAELQPRAAAAVLSALPIERAAALIEKLGQQPSVVILRHVDEPLRVQLLAQLPAATAFATRLLLGYPDDSVGACVNPNVVAVLAVTLVGDLLEKVRNLDAAVDEVFVVDTERRLLGWVRLDSVLRASESTAVGSLLLAAPAVLPARIELCSVSESPVS